MKTLFCYIFLFFGIFCYEKSYSQNEYPKEKVRLDSDIWMSLNTQISLNKNTHLDSTAMLKDILLIQILGKHSTMERTDTDFFYQKSLYLTYEHLLSQKWIGGISYRYSQINITANALRGYLRHYSPIKKIDITLWQQIAFERILFNNSFYDPISRLRFQFAANKYFSISAKKPQKKLIGTISFELFKEIQKINPNSERRFFQEQRIQTEWFFPIHQNIYLGAFAGCVTKQFIALAQFNMAGEELKPTRRLNQQTPIFGIHAILTLGKSHIPTKRLWIE